MPAMPRPVPMVSVIVPAYREAPNLVPLTERVFRALCEAGIEGEMIVVDDNSQDGTETVIEELAERFPIRLVVRRSERGLSGAVLRGFAEARADRFVVLDADLQHPPEAIPRMVQALSEPSCDFVLATRYGEGGSVASEWPRLRRLISLLLSLAARPLAAVSDPMSGFFALPRRTWEQAERLDPLGYKIALELLVKSRCRHIREVPIRFGVRAGGKSKARLRTGWQYFRHLIRLYRFRFPWMSRIVAGLILLTAVWSVLRLLAGHPS